MTNQAFFVVNLRLIIYEYLDFFTKQLLSVSPFCDKLVHSNYPPCAYARAIRIWPPKSAVLFDKKRLILDIGPQQASIPAPSRYSYAAK